MERGGGIPKAKFLPNQDGDTRRHRKREHKQRFDTATQEGQGGEKGGCVDSEGAKCVSNHQVGRRPQNRQIMWIITVRGGAKANNLGKRHALTVHP